VVAFASANASEQRSGAVDIAGRNGFGGDMQDSAAALIGDVGGTNCRLALAELSPDAPPAISDIRVYRCDGFPTFEAAAATYLRETGATVSDAVIAVAGPVADGSVAMTNCAWEISEGAAADALRLASCRLINDFEALGHALPALTTADVLPLGGGALAPMEGATMAVMGAGTGFGTAALVRNRGLQAVLVAEGGHMSFAPGDALQIEVWQRLTARYGYVQVEHILSGPGLMNLHRALCDIDRQTPRFETPDAITEAAGVGDAAALAVTDLFVKVFGQVASDLALAFGARGGVFIAGGVSQRVLSSRNAAAFRARFEAKGEFSPYVIAIPTALITHEQPGLLGAACALMDGLPPPARR
jgi:glucokinase